MREYFRQFFESGYPVEVVGTITRFGYLKFNAYDTIVSASKSGMLYAPILFCPPDPSYATMPIRFYNKTTCIALTDVNGNMVQCGSHIWYLHDLSEYGYQVGAMVKLRANIGVYQRHNSTKLDFCLLPDTVTIKR